MSLETQSTPENLEPQEPKPKIVMKYNTATIDEHGNIDGQPILQNCSATVGKNRLERYTNTEGNSGYITRDVSKNSKFDIEVAEFNPKTGSIKCSIDGLDFTGTVEPVYKNVKGEDKFLGFMISSKSSFIKMGSIVKSGLKKVHVTEENINHFQRKFYFDSMTFHTDDIELGVLENDGFVNLYSINENNSPANSTSIFKLAIAAILGASVTYGAQNISTQSVKDFASGTKNEIENTLNKQNSLRNLKVIIYDVKPNDTAIKMLKSYAISQYNEAKINKISLKAGDVLTVEYNGNELISIYSEMDGKIY